jgi:hypothetical protein
MPCQTCKEYYSILPCELRISSDTILTERTYSSQGYDGCRKLVTIHGILHGYCPCQECLIKVMCQEFCGEFENRIETWVRTR